MKRGGFPNISRLRDSTVCVCVWNCSEHFLANQGGRRPRIETRFYAYRKSIMSSGHAAVNPNRCGLKQTKQTQKAHVADTAVFQYCTCHLISSTWVAAAKGLLQPHPHFFFIPRMTYMQWRHPYEWASYYETLLPPRLRKPQIVTCSYPFLSHLTSVDMSRRAAAVRGYLEVILCRAVFPCIVTWSFVDVNGRFAASSYSAVPASRCPGSWNQPCLCPWCWFFFLRQAAQTAQLCWPWDQLLAV